MVELQNVSVTYSSGVDALNNISLKINDGDFAFVVGSSGAGKSTMIKLLLKEIDATSGTVTVNGYNLNKLKKRKIPEFRRTLGFVFQDFRLIPSMTVYENIAFVLRVIDAQPKFIKKRVPYVISLVGLDSRKDSYPDELSGGEKQRVAIARALVNDPQLIIADEPTGNIDPELSYEIVELLKGINDMGTTVLMVTHEHELVRHFGGRVISITNGEIVFDEVVTSTSDKILEEEILAAASQPENETVREEINENIQEYYPSTEDELMRSMIDLRNEEGLSDETEEDMQEIIPEAASPPPSAGADDVIAEITGGMEADEIIAKITADARDGSVSEKIVDFEEIIDPKQTVEDIMKEIAENPEDPGSAEKMPPDGDDGTGGNV
ncbi:MAG: cell division ATP-binding protein FtsE [Ruminococcus sp.]|nr:cell division ATP-binding protein FtsE [Ruminococcus sp.]